MSNKAPHTKFGKIRSIPVLIYVNGKEAPNEKEWDEEMWVERGEDWYGLGSVKKGRRVRIIQREEWLRAEDKLSSEDRDKKIKDMQKLIADENSKGGIFGGSHEAVRLAIRELHKLGQFENELVSYDEYLKL